MICMNETRKKKKKRAKPKFSAFCEKRTKPFVKKKIEPNLIKNQIFVKKKKEPQISFQHLSTFSTKIFFLYVLPIMFYPSG